MQSLVVLMFNVLLGCLYTQVNTKPSIRFRQLSEVEHHPHGGGHDVRFDHEAFLGKEESAKYDQLSPEESAAKLSELFDKVDTSNNGRISREEMKAWIKHVQDMQIEEESRKDYKDYGGLADILSFETYSKEAHFDESFVLPEDVGKHRQQKERARRKWEVADTNQDENLSLKEFMAFSNPLHFEHMHDFYVKDALEDMDEDGDGLVSYKEFERSRWRPTTEGEETPEWLTDEIKTMAKFFDANSDGQYDLKEFSNWLIPPGHDPFEAETIHLFAHADVNKDNRLTREEVMNNRDLFVGSQATGYGKVLKNHEEL